eukprot:8620784-Pyramimonas_sp.AAC.1
MQGRSLDETNHHVYGGRPRPLSSCHAARAGAECLRRRGESMACSCRAAGPYRSLAGCRRRAKTSL